MKYKQKIRMFTLCAMQMNRVIHICCSQMGEKSCHQCRCAVTVKQVTKICKAYKLPKTTMVYFRNDVSYIFTSKLIHLGLYPPLCNIFYRKMITINIVFLFLKMTMAHISLAR